ncbi:MAG: ABC transporter ATP-binding protein [Rhodocyclaceae bacterium]|nr:ABC transporter ATP-binding protein [Rhodocyclaceae bacterium]
MALLELRNITRRFGALEAVKDVSLAIEAGEFFTLLGPSGCGKTTILRMIAGFDAPDAGDILLDGASLSGVPPEKRPLHTVFQSYALFPHMTVAGNLAFPLEMAGVGRAEIARRVGEMLALVHLEDKADRYPHELSGGQKQRVALARGLINRPRLLLLDEPLGALDAKLRLEMQGDLIRLQREVGITFVFVTHAQQEALALSHRIAVMRAGRIEQCATPDVLYTQPANRFVADFIGRINLIEAEVIALTPEGARLRSATLGELLVAPPPACALGDRGAFALRPERVCIAAPGESVELDQRYAGRIRSALYVGETTLYQIALESGQIIEALEANTSPGRARRYEAGDPVIIGWAKEAGVFLHDES